MISASELLSQLTGFLVILGSPADQQRAWAEERGVPIDEMMIQFLDAVPAWIPRLRDNHLVDDQDELTLLRVRVQFDDSMRGRTHLFQHWSEVATSGAWERVRELAKAALDSLYRPRESGPPARPPDDGT